MLTPDQVALAALIRDSLKAIHARQAANPHPVSDYLAGSEESIEALAMRFADIPSVDRDAFRAACGFD